MLSAAIRKQEQPFAGFLNCDSVIFCVTTFIQNYFIFYTDLNMLESQLSNALFVDLKRVESSMWVNKVHNKWRNEMN